MSSRRRSGLRNGPVTGCKKARPIAVRWTKPVTNVMWEMDLRGVVFVPQKSACPVRVRGERECSFTHSFICSMCAYSVQYCAGYWGHNGKRDMASAFMKPTGIIISLHVCVTDFFEKRMKPKDAVLTQIPTHTHTHTLMHTCIYVHTKSYTISQVYRSPEDPLMDSMLKISSHPAPPLASCVTLHPHSHPPLRKVREDVDNGKLDENYTVLSPQQIL